MHRFFVSVAVLFSFLSSIGGSLKQTEVPADEEDVYFILSGEADKAISESDYPTAIERLKEAIVIRPDSPSNVLLLSNLGILYNYIDQDSLALDAFNQAIAKAPSLTVGLINRGKLYLKMGEDEKAINDFGKVIECDSTNVDALFYHGLMGLYSGRQQQAENDFSHLASLAPGSINTAIALASLYSMTGRESQAVPYLQQLIKMDPQAEYYSNLAGCYLTDELLSEASAVLKEGLELFPDDPELFLYRAWLNKKRYMLKESRQDAKQAVKLGANPCKVEQLLKD